MSGYDASIECMPRSGFLDLRGGDAVRVACSEVLGVTLPCIANTLVAAAEERLAHCISSDHWLLQVADGDQQHVLRDLELATADLSHSFVDVSDMYACIQLSGAEARDVLAQGVSVDIHPRVFSPGNTARIGFAKTTAQLQCVDELPTFILTVTSSYRQHALDWLRVAIGDA